MIAHPNRHLGPELLTTIWNQAFSPSLPLRQDLAEQFLSVDVEPAATFATNDGFVVAKRRGSQAWIAAVAVRPAAGGRGLGSDLLDRCRAGLREVGVVEASLGGDYLHLLPGIPESPALGWLERRGARLEPGWEVDLHRHLDPGSGEVVPTRVEAATSWDEVLSFLAGWFPGRWHWEAEEERRRGGPPDGHLVVRVESEVAGFVRVHGPGVRSRLIGPSVYWPQPGGQLGGIGPIGVGAPWRGLGLGGELLQAAIAVLQRRGATDLVVDWTDLPAFYEREGFEVVRRYRGGRLRV